MNEKEILIEWITHKKATKTAALEIKETQKRNMEETFFQQVSSVYSLIIKAWIS